MTPHAKSLPRSAVSGSPAASTAAACNAAKTVTSGTPGRTICHARSYIAPQQAIHAGYERAWATILDSNVTTLIAGLALLAFGSGPVKGFAVVHCLGIVTYIFSAVMVSRGIVNGIYGGRRKIKRVSIGNTDWHKSRDQKGVAV